MTKISKKQTLIYSLCSKNFTESLMNSFFDRQYDRLSWNRKSFLNCQIHVNTKNFLSRFRNSETIKLSNLGSFMLSFLIMENGEAIYKVLRYI